MKNAILFALIFPIAVSCSRISLDFSGIGWPEGEEGRHSIRSTESAVFQGKDIAIQYRTFLRSGEAISGGVYGQVLSRAGQPVRNVFRSLGVNDGPLAGVSNFNDFTTMLERDGNLFVVQHFESVPGAVYITSVKRDEEGRLIPVSTRNLDFAEQGGVYSPCAGSITPWGSHIGSEEYEPNAGMRDALGRIDTRYNAMAGFFSGDTSRTDVLRNMNPYLYGWTPEVIVLDGSGKTETRKRYALGRFSHEIAVVMPDRRTVYMSDDGKHGTLFLFVADKPGDLTAGTLYAARWNQRKADVLRESSVIADLQWISLGHATEAQIESVLKSDIVPSAAGPSGPLFQDLFDAVAPVSNACPEGFTAVDGGTSNLSAPDSKLECLKLKSGEFKGVPVSVLASRLESRRYAVMLGATAEFNKKEGVAYDDVRNRLYFAVSRIEKAMQPEKGKGIAADHIRLTANRCGAVFAADLKADTSINSHYVIGELYPLVLGRPLPESQVTNRKTDLCDPDRMAEPDNIAFLPGSDLLFIAEDADDGHSLNFLWSYNVRTGNFRRLLHGPRGAEITSPSWIRLGDGSLYFFATVMHPYRDIEDDGGPGGRAVTTEERRATTGYFGPFR